MESNSRTAKSIKNSIIALIYYVVTLVLQFYARRIFLDYLGSEILGLNTTALNLLQFLNLAELGISSAVGFTLYKPLRENDHITINEIVTLQGKLYRRIAYFIICGAIVLMLFFPLIFNKITIPLWYAYASFGVLLFSALLGYFFNYKQIVLSANQQDYRILFSYKSVMLLKVVAQVFAVYYLSDGYDWWLILEALFAVIATISLTITTNKTFPFLSKKSHSFAELRLKYPELERKIKQLFFHKIGAFALNQSSPLIIYAFTSLTTVALYGNYILIITGIQMLVIALFNSTAAGVGNLVAGGDNKKIKDVFIQLFGLRFVIVTILGICTYLLSQPFIKLWIGEQYIMNQSTIILMFVIFYLNLFRYTVDTYLSAFGLFQDIWAPVVESILNIGLSVAFGVIWGLNGVLVGVIISLVLVIAIWKPIFLFRNTSFYSLKGYCIIYCKHILALLITVSVGLWIYTNMPLPEAENWFQLIIIGCCCFAIFGTLILSGVALINKPFFRFLINLLHR